MLVRLYNYCFVVQCIGVFIDTKIGNRRRKCRKLSVLALFTRITLIKLAALVQDRQRKASSTPLSHHRLTTVINPLLNGTSAINIARLQRIQINIIGREPGPTLRMFSAYFFFSTIS